MNLVSNKGTVHFYLFTIASTMRYIMYWPGLPPPPPPSPDLPMVVCLIIEVA